MASRGKIRFFFVGIEEDVSFFFFPRRGPGIFFCVGLGCEINQSYSDLREDFFGLCPLSCPVRRAIHPTSILALCGHEHRLRKEISFSSVEDCGRLSPLPSSAILGMRLLHRSDSSGPFPRASTFSGLPRSFDLRQGNENSSSRGERRPFLPPPLRRRPRPP